MRRHLEQLEAIQGDAPYLGNLIGEKQMRVVVAIYEATIEEKAADRILPFTGYPPEQLKRMRLQAIQRKLAGNGGAG